MAVQLRKLTCWLEEAPLLPFPKLPLQLRKLPRSPHSLANLILENTGKSRFLTKVVGTADNVRIWKTEILFPIYLCITK